MKHPEAQVFTIGGAFTPEDVSYPEDVFLITVTGLKDRSTFFACFERALSEHAGGVIRRTSPYQIEGQIYDRFFIDKDPPVTFFLNTDLATPLIWLLKKEEDRREEAIAVIEEAKRICNENELFEYRYQVELNFGTNRLPFEIDLGDCLVYQFQAKDLALPPRDTDSGFDPFASERNITTGFGQWTGPVQVFYSFAEGTVQAFHFHQATARASKDAEEVALFLSVMFKTPIYTKMGAGVANDAEGGFTEHRRIMKAPMPVFSEGNAEKVDRPDISSTTNPPIMMVGQTRDITVPSDIQELYSRFQSIAWGNKQLFLMAAAVYRTALRLLVSDRRRWSGEAAQANLLLWSALEAVVGRGKKVGSKKETKEEAMNKYIVKRLGDTELTQKVMEMWKHRCRTAHQSIVWSWQLFDEEDARLEVGQTWEWHMQVSNVGAVERVVNAIMIDYLAN